MSKKQEHNYVGVPAFLFRKLNAHEGATLDVEGQKLIVRKVTVHDSREKQLYVSDKTFAKIKKSRETLKLTVGCDPEFVLINEKDGSVFQASRIWSYRGEIGSDGPLAELRPRPAKHEDELTENIKELILGVGRRLEGKGIRAEAHSCINNMALGFHVHIGLPRQVLDFQAKGAYKFVQRFVQALDFFVGIPTMALEDDNIRRLGDGAYGKPSDFRTSPDTLEYRTPGGFYLRHPDYTRGLLGLSLCVAEQILREAEVKCRWKNLETYTKTFHESYGIPESKDVRSVLMDPRKRRATEMLPNILRKVSQFDTYEEHRGAISRLFLMIVNNEQFSPLLLENWK